MSSKWQEQPIDCVGGLEVTENHMFMNRFSPGSAIALVNYEISPSGGYARVLGYEKFNADYPEVGVGSTEGSILGIFYYVDSTGQSHYYAARKNTSGTTYSVWKYNSGGAWTSVTMPSTRNTSSGGRNITRLRWKLYNDGASNWLVIVDGVNPALIYDGTTWRDITSSNTGTTSSPGGAQVITYPNYISVWKQHLFLARCDGCSKAIVCHSAPNAPYNFTSAAGAGQITPGFDVEQIHSFRDTLYVFGENDIGAIEVSGTTFVYKTIATDVGCIAPDTVGEMGSSIVFLSQDGFRPIAGTDRIGDIEIAPITEPVRPLLLQIINNFGKSAINSIFIKSKSQMRMSYAGNAAGTTSPGFSFIMGKRINRNGQFNFESGQLYQIDFWSGFSEVVGGEEVTLHGGYDGIVYKQEIGNNFDGGDIFSSFSGPYLDQGAVSRRKSYKKVLWFTRIDYSSGTAQDPPQFSMSNQFDWGDVTLVRPPDYTIYGGVSQVQYDAFGIAYDGTSKYSGATPAVIESDIEGSGFSMKCGIVTTGQTPRHTIFGYVVVFEGEGVE